MVSLRLGLHGGARRAEYATSGGDRDKQSVPA